MRHHNLQVTGSVVVNGLGLATTADLNTYTASADAKISTLQAFTSSVGTTNTFTASASGRLDSIETITASNAARLNSLEVKTGSLATTGSNTFIGTQTITGSLFISSDLIVQGSSSLQNITASAVSIGTNIINLNTANPAIRFAGLVIGDSGSVGGSGSFLYDSIQDEMIFVHRGSSTVVTSSVILMGPQTYDTIGTETYPTSNIIQKGTGNEHLVDSCIFDNGTTTCVKNNFIGTGMGLFSGQLSSTGNADTSAGLVINNSLGNSGICQHYINFTAGATTIARMFRGNGASGATANGLNIDNFGGFQVRLNQLGGSGDSFNILGGNIGINTCTPSNLLHIEASNNTTNQLRVNSCDGLNAGLRSYTTCDGAGLIINHYYAVGGAPYLRTSDFVSNQGDAAATQMRFFTKDASANPALAMIITSGRCVGINTNNPQSVLDVQNCINSSYDPTNTLISNQWLRTSNPSTSACATSGILFVAQGPGGGNGISTINGVTTSCGSMSITFGTRHSSGAITERMRILSYGLVGIGTSTPFLHMAGDISGLVVKGTGGDARGIIEVHSGTDSGKAVFQQVGGTTYIGNLDKGTSGGSLRLLVNGSGASAAEALIINCASRVLINNSAAVGTGADYSRVTISGTCTKTQLPGVGGSILHLTSCENDNPFGAKFNIVGNENSCLRYLQIQTGDHNITNQGNIVFQNAGGHVGVGTTSPRTKLQVTPNYNAEVPVLGCASGIATFTSTNTNYGLQLNSTSDGSFHLQSQRFDGNTTAYPLILNWAGGNVLVGTNSSLGKLTVGGTVAIPALVGGDIYTIDTMNGYQSIANGGFIDFNGMSGFLMVNNWTNGATTLFVMGGGNTGVVGTITGTAGTVHHSPGVGGYRWCNNYGSTATFGFQVFRTRNTA